VGVGLELDAQIDPDAWLLQLSDHAARTWVEPPPPPADGVRPSMPKRSTTGSRPAVELPVAHATVAAEVIVVDFDATLTRTLRAAMTSEDTTVVVARHGLEALSLCVRRRPVLVVVGRMMPGISGTTFIKELRARGLGVQVILVENARLAATPPTPPVAERGVHTWAQVPFDLAVLRKKLDDVLVGARGDVMRDLVPGGDARALAGLIFECAERWLVAGSLDDAVFALRYVAELAPSVPAYGAALGWALFVRNHKDDTTALTILERVLRQAPNEPHALASKGAILRFRGQNDDARVVLAKALRVDPDNVLARHELHALLSPSAPPPPERKPASSASAKEPAENTPKPSMLSRLLRR
jgi:CheY-like chemotaxis protein